MSGKEAAKERLDQFALNIEFLLISVVQGLALGVLANSAVGVVDAFNFEYLIYVVSGFILILTFWSSAIVHALSFVDWPLDLTHSFLYFLSSLIEVIVFAQVTHPLTWFIFTLVFFGVAAVLYLVDLRLIKSHKASFEESESGKQLYRHIIKRHLFELKYLVPSGAIFNVVCVYLIYKFPAVFIVGHWHLVLGFFQIVFGLLALVNSVDSFKGRVRLITKRFLE